MGNEQAKGDGSEQVSFCNHWSFDEWKRYCGAALNTHQDWKEAMEKHNHEDHSHNWPPPKHELEQFKLTVHIDGYSEFALRSDPCLPEVLLLLFPRNPMHGALCVARCSREFKWRIECDFAMASAVAAAIPRAEVFMRNWYERDRQERTPLPVDCSWVEPKRQGELPRVYDKQYGIEYDLILNWPPTDRGVSIMRAIMQEGERLRNEKARADAPHTVMHCYVREG